MIIQFLLVFLCLFLPICAKEHHYALSACAIFKDEAPYLDEWIRYHQAVGVEHFWLYNNSSSDDYQRVLNPWIKKGVVELTDWPNLDIPGFWGYVTQPAAYRNALGKSSGKTDWLAIIDVDEFLVPMKLNSVEKTLRKEYKDAVAIYVNWLQFGTGNITVGPGPILHVLTRCAPRENEWNTIGKSIVRPEAVVSCVEPHFCILRSPLLYFNGDGHMIMDYKHHDSLIRINHYTFRDEWCFRNVKIPRYLKWGHTIEEMKKKNDEFSASKDYRMIELLRNF